MAKKDQWVEERIADLLPCPYYHVVFTLPHAFNRVIMQSPREMYNILFAAASKTLLCLGEDKQFLGAAPGITAILHTWGQKLDYHVHLHCVVSGGGINAQGRWVPPKRANGKFLFPEAVLKKVYKAIFLRLLQEHKQNIHCEDNQIDGYTIITLITKSLGEHHLSSRLFVKRSLAIRIRPTNRIFEARVIKTSLES